MQETAEITDHPPGTAFLTTLPADRRQYRIAASLALLSFALFAVAVVYAKLPLQPVPVFIPIYESILVVNDLITALLLFGQFRIARSKAVLVLASGYLFTALAACVHLLTFPGAFAPGGLLGAGPQTTAWLYMFWHGGFPLFVMAYTVLRRPGQAQAPAARPAAAAVFAALAVLGAVAAFAVLATVFHRTLPPIMDGSHYTPVMRWVVTASWVASIVALAMLWRKRPHSVVDVWLMVVMFAWVLDIGLSAVFNAGRFDLGFYAGRIYGLLASSFVLGVLLLENGFLYAGLVEAHGREHRRAQHLEQLSAKFQAFNAQLEDMNARLMEQTRLKTEFLSSMSHELRTPLNSVIGFSDMLKEGMVDDEGKQRQFASHIYTSGKHLLSLINDILDLSKIEAGKVELNLGPVDLRAAMEEVLALLQAQAQAKHLQLNLSGGSGPAVLRADRRRLQQIALNLASNAMKFSPDGGRVSVAWQAVDRRRALTALPGFPQGVRLPLPDNGHERFAEITVTDAGIGMSPDDMRRLFVPFTQISNAVTRTAEGTGLGLVMVLRLAELHGGTVAMTSEPGKGSCFTVWIPWLEEVVADPVPGDSPSPASSAARPLAAGARASRLALVVEDHAQAAALMREQLQAKGFQVRQASSAEAALQLVDECTPDLITLDIVLPGLDGWEFLARIKATPAWESIPVVVVSVVADEHVGFSLGAAAVLQKPIDGNALDRSLARLGFDLQQRLDMTALVIDDDPTAVELLAVQLQQRRCVVLRALGGQEGIHLAQRFRPDLITLDLEMPRVNGFDVVEALKADPATAQTPIVVVTAKDLSTEDRRRLHGHVQQIVGKTEFDRGRFSAEVERALSKVA